MVSAANKYFKKFKVLLEKVKKDGPEGMKTAEVAGLKESLCRAVACYRVALAGARDQNNLYRSREERGTGVDRIIGRVAARALVVCASYLAPRVWPSARLSVYCDAAGALVAALELGGDDRVWVEGGPGRRGVGEVFREMVDQLRGELPELVEGAKSMGRAGELVSFIPTLFILHNYVT